MNTGTRNDSPTIQHTDGRAATWWEALKQSARSALHINRAQITALPAIRGTLGYVLPLSIGVATGHVIEGVSIAGGAALIGSVGFTYTYRVRIRTMLLASLGIGLSALVGGLTGPIDWLLVPITGLWGLGAGILVAIDQPSMTVGLQCCLALIVLAHLQLNPLQAVEQAGLLFSGAMLQVILALIPVPFRQTTPERDALSSIYQKLANYATHPDDSQSRQQVRDAFTQAYNTLSGTNAQSWQGHIFFHLLEEAERIRLSLIVLHRTRYDLTEHMSEQSQSVRYLDQLIQAAAGTLLEVASNLQFAHTVSHIVRPHHHIKSALDALRQQELPPDEKEQMRQTLAYCDRLRDLLHSAKKLSKSWRYSQQRPSTLLHPPNIPRPHIHDTWITLHANLSLESSAFRHAIRLGITLTIATAIDLLAFSPVQRGYWIPLTALLVLRPDFSNTFTRGVARLLGTIIGAVLLSILIARLAPNNVAFVILASILLYLSYTFLFANYAIFSVFVTAEVVLLLTFVIPTPLMTADYRAINTVIGGGLALLAYVLWPTWERPQVMNNIARRIDAVRDYTVEVLHAYMYPETYNPNGIHNHLMQARLARSNAESSLERSLQEPEPHRIEADVAQGLLAASDRVMQHNLTLEAYLSDNAKHHSCPALDPFAHTVDSAMQTLVTTVRQEQHVTASPDLDAPLHALKHADDGHQKHDKHFCSDLSEVMPEVKGIARNVNIMYRLMTSRDGEKRA